MTVQVMLVLLMSSCILHGANSEGRHNQLIRGVRIKQEQQQEEITRQLLEVNDLEAPRSFSSFEYQFGVDINVATATQTSAPTTGTDETARTNSEPTAAPIPAIIYSDEGEFLPAGATDNEEEPPINREPGNLDEATTETEAQAAEEAPTATPDPLLVDDEADNFLPAPADQGETTGKSSYYYVDLRPFSVFVETTQDLSMDLGIPLYLLLEMGETLGNLVDVKISNLTIHMGVTYNPHGHDHDDDNAVRRARRNLDEDSDYAPDHLHWNQLFFQGKAEFEDSVVYPAVTVQNVQSLVLSNEASLQDFWDTQGMGATYQHLELKNITMLPFPVETTPEPTPSPTVQTSEPTTLAPSVLQSETVEYPDAETDRSSNVWVMVPLVVVFLMICFCIIGLCGRLQYLSSRAQDRYNEKYGLDYNVYDKDIGREIFKEEYLMSEHDGHDFSHSSAPGLSDSLRSIEGFLSRPISTIKSARRSSQTKVNNPTNDEISTEEEEEDTTTQGSPSGGGGDSRSVTPNNSQTRHDGSFMPTPTPELQGSSRSIEAMPTEERSNGQAAVTDDEDSSQPPEVFVDEFSDNEGLEPPAVPRENASMAPIAPSENIPIKRAEPRQKSIADSRAPYSENMKSAHNERAEPRQKSNKRAEPRQKSIPETRVPPESIKSIPNQKAEVGEANLLDLPDFTAPPMSPRMEQSKPPEFENHDHVHSTPTKDNRTNVVDMVDMVDTVPIVAMESSARSTGSFNSSSLKRGGSKGDMGNSSLRDRSSRGSFRSQGSFGSEKGGMGNSSGRDRSTRSTRSIRSIESASSVGSFYSCQGDLV